MELRVDPAKGPKNPFSFAMEFATKYASTVDHVFDAVELWGELSKSGLFFEDQGQRVAEGSTTQWFGVFTTQLALDHLFNQRLLQRTMNAKGDYVYRGAT